MDDDTESTMVTVACGRKDIRGDILHVRAMLDTTDGKGCTLGTKEKYVTVMQPLEFDDVETVHQQSFHH